MSILRGIPMSLKMIRLHFNAPSEDRLGHHVKESSNDQPQNLLSLQTETSRKSYQGTTITATQPCFRIFFSCVKAMNGDGKAVKMEEEIKGKLVYMWGYLPGALPQRSPLTSPVAVRVPPTIGSFGDSWKDVCGGGCGFAMAISGALSLCHYLIFVFSLVMWIHSFFF